MANFSPLTVLIATRGTSLVEPSSPNSVSSWPKVFRLATAKLSLCPASRKLRATFITLQKQGNCFVIDGSRKSDGHPTLWGQKTTTNSTSEPSGVSTPHLLTCECFVNWGMNSTMNDHICWKPNAFTKVENKIRTSVFQLILWKCNTANKNYKKLFSREPPLPELFSKGTCSWRNKSSDRMRTSLSKHLLQLS